MNASRIVGEFETVSVHVYDDWGGGTTAAGTTGPRPGRTAVSRIQTEISIGRTRGVLWKVATRGKVATRAFLLTAPAGRTSRL